MGYSIWWPLLGAALLLLCLGAVAWIWISTRPPRETAVPGFVAPRNPESVRARYLQLIGGIESRHDAGELGGRDCHLELSLAVRTFVYEMTGLQTQRMTLAQLRTHGLPLVGDAVELLYPGEFSAYGGQLTASQAVHLARGVVQSWR
ncbi:hypothetical protein ACFUCV_02440 [Specibacter sp. NPDC057265]|uniref:hypothetical protein n=1 Tax=Specibacter sp. NPDC057265 TaxID=3346075 RepID=UPI003642147E